MSNENTLEKRTAITNDIESAAKKHCSSAASAFTAVGFNSMYQSHECIAHMGNAFQQGQSTTYPLVSDKPSAQVYANPFRAVTLSSIFCPAFLSKVRSALLAQPFELKSNDLYHFYQSNDLKTTSDPVLATLRDTIYSLPFVKFIEEITGMKLSKTVDLSGHRYPENGYLLCHDDAIGSVEDGRRIAFIIYLVEEDWCADDGGMLQLFDCDDQGNPSRIVSSIVPQWNSMAFFEVLPTSHHEVQQVFCARDRVSISGWFHGPPQTIPKAPTSDMLSTHPALKKWLNPTYLVDKNMAAIQSRMAHESTVELQQFLNPDQYMLLKNALDQASFDCILGPANIQRVRVLGDTEVPAPEYIQLIDEFKGLLKSNVFSVYLESISGLELKRAPATASLRCFGPGDYTLMHDGGQEPLGLDVVFSCPVGEEHVEWNDTVWSGGMHYVFEKETLLSLFPKENTLFLVYRDQGTMRFVKMLTAKCEKLRREVSLVYEEHK
ncbi:hypothetical protein BATDEDRAFT_91279 [Batrachochytrium dendrobatidis JAM81]|uniref:Fe2OG dioxygenase domain-containing protein n=2 Tax=Batrachochytrium dendrobatidis TaxID=109871 RepID=F4PA44_BATDJ|eukprot:XP_006681492.1 hypothetical protein BATDEDRAFT_91279 [Batrachochytrium dendrobatidis JAM81]